MKITSITTPKLHTPTQHTEYKTLPTNYTWEMTKLMHQNPNTLKKPNSTQKPQQSPTPPPPTSSPYHIQFHNCSINRSTPPLWTSFFITVIHQYKTSSINYRVHFPLFIANHTSYIVFFWFLVLCQFSLHVILCKNLYILW